MAMHWEAAPHTRFFLSIFLSSRSTFFLWHPRQQFSGLRAPRWSQIISQTCFSVADDLRNELGVYKGKNAVSSRLPGIKTPNLDKLAGHSLLFNNAYCQYALCGPSRTSVLTSRRPDTTQGTDWANAQGL